MGQINIAQSLMHWDELQYKPRKDAGTSPSQEVPEMALLDQATRPLDAWIFDFHHKPNI